MRGPKMLGAIILLLAWAIHCNSDSGTSPSFPQPVVVKATTLPKPLPATVYLLRGEQARNAAERVLKELLAIGLTITEAWESYESMCMRIYDPPELAVRLSREDSRILKFGFVQARQLDGCYATWKYYRF